MMKKEEKDSEIPTCDKIIDTVGYKYPLCCLALWLFGMIVFAIVISENSK
tara:strand:- start:433 stop:582 length:150 start_codon:yes stop_codon:yes gene_type:complete